MGNLIYFQPPGINPKFCEVGMFIEGDTEHIYYLHDPCKIHKDEVVIIPEENVIINFRKREYRVKTKFKPKP